MVIDFNGTKKIYLDHAATTPVCREVREVMDGFFSVDFGNPSSIYSLGSDAKKSMERFRSEVAVSINADPSEIFFTSGGTEGNNWAIRGAAYGNKLKGRHLITSLIEHHSVLRVFQALEKEGFEVTYLPVDSSGLVSPDDLKKAIRQDTVLVSIMTANNEIGTIQPVREFADICRENKIIFHSDGVQALGTLEIDVKKIGADILTFSGHKIYAPKGVGFIYIKRGTRINPLLYGGGQEKGRRPGTENLPYIAALSKALSLVVNEREEVYSRQILIRDELIDKVLKTIPYMKLNGSRDKRLPGNINFSFEFIEGESLLLMLDNKGYLCSSGSACTSGDLNPSHVLLAIGLPHEVAHGSLRISLGKDTNADFIDKFVEDLDEIVKRLRVLSPLYDDFLAGKIKSFTETSTSDK